MKIIYLASPYTHKNKWKQFWRYIQTCYVTAQLFKKGVMVYSSIAHTVIPALLGRMYSGYDIWQEYDHELIRRFDSVMVLTLDGWETSVGVADEIVFAKSIGKPVEYMEFKDVV